MDSPVTLSIPLTSYSNVTFNFQSNSQDQFDGFWGAYYVVESGYTPTSDQKCPHGCSNRGTCVDGVCQCNDGVIGAGCNNDDILLLTAMYSQCDGINWYTNDNWATTPATIPENPCTTSTSNPSNFWSNWDQIDCTLSDISSYSRRVSYMDFSTNFGWNSPTYGPFTTNGNNLKCTNYPMVPYYAYWLDLSYNTLGYWPNNTLHYTKDLNVLYMDNANITGAISVDLIHFTNLQYLTLSNTNLSGFIPDGADRLIGLQYVVFDNSQITGLLPSLWQYLPTNSISAIGAFFWCPNLQDSWDSITQMECVNITIDSSIPVETTTEKNVFYYTGSNLYYQYQLQYFSCQSGTSTGSVAMLNGSAVECTFGALPAGSTTASLLYKSAVVSTTHKFNITAICTNGTYTKDSFTCISCPDGAVCEGEMAQPFNKEGYMPLHSDLLTFYKCYNAEACPEGNETYMGCKYGYKGELCVECDADVGYTGWGEGECSFCGESEKVKGRAAVVCILIFFCLLCMYLAIDHYAFSTGGIMILFLQTTGVLAKYDFGWNGWYSTSLNFFRFFVLDMASLNIECAFGVDYQGEVIIAFMIPIFGFCFLLISYVIKRVIFKNKDALNETTTAMILLIGFLHLPLTDVAFNTFNCRHDDALGRYYNIVHPEVLCNSKSNIVTQVFGVLIIVFYSVGSALLFLGVLTAKRKRLRDPKVFHRWGDIYKPFKDRAYWWEPYQMLFHVLLSVIPVMFVNSPPWLGICVFILMALHIIMLATFSPYRLPANNKLSGLIMLQMSLFVVTGLVYLGLSSNSAYSQQEKARLVWPIATFDLVTQIMIIVILAYFMVYERYYAKHHHYHAHPLWSAFVRTRLFVLLFPHKAAEEDIKKLHMHLRLEHHHGAHQPHDKPHGEKLRGGAVIVIKNGKVAPEEDAGHEEENSNLKMHQIDYENDPPEPIGDDDHEVEHIQVTMK